MEWSEYQQMRLDMLDRTNMGQWGETNIKCPECGANIYRNNWIILTSNPPQYQYKCLNCDWSGTSY